MTWYHGFASVRRFLFQNADCDCTSQPCLPPRRRSPVLPPLLLIMPQCVSQAQAIQTINSSDLHVNELFAETTDYQDTTQALDYSSHPFEPAAEVACPALGDTCNVSSSSISKASPIRSSKKRKLSMSDYQVTLSNRVSKMTRTGLEPEGGVSDELVVLSNHTTSKSSLDEDHPLTGQGQDLLCIVPSIVRVAGMGIVDSDVELYDMECDNFSPALSAASSTSFGNFLSRSLVFGANSPDQVFELVTPDKRFDETEDSFLAYLDRLAGDLKQPVYTSDSTLSLSYGEGADIASLPTSSGVSEPNMCVGQARVLVQPRRRRLQVDIEMVELENDY